MTCGGFMHSAGPKPVLTYFEGQGLAEQTRLTFIVGGVPFVDRRITKEEWQSKYKAMSPTGQAPFLEVDGEILVQSLAILLYAAKRAGLMPDLDVEHMEGMMLMGMIDSFKNKLSDAVYGMEEAERAQKLREIAGQELPVTLTMLEKAVAKNSAQTGYLVGSKLSYVDVMVAGTMAGFAPFLESRAEELLADYPSLLKAYKTVYADQRVKRYVAEREGKPILTYFDMQGRAEPARWAFDIGKIEFEDNRVTPEEWAALKATSPTGRVPMMQVGDQVYAESNAILLYAAKRAGLVPKRDVEYAHAMSLVYTCEAVFEPLMKAFVGPEAERPALLKEVLPTAMPPVLKRLNDIAGMKMDGEGHSVGGKLSFADLHLANVYKFLSARPFGLIIENLEDQVPNVVKIYKMVMNIPAVKARNMRTKTRPVLTYFDLTGRAEAVRLIFAVGSIDYEDRRVTEEDWPTIYKAASPTGQCPYLEVDEEIYAETSALIRYAAERADLVPYTYKGRMHADQLLSAYTSRVIGTQIKQYAKAKGPERQAEVARLAVEEMPKVLEIIDRMAGNKQSLPEGYLVDNRLTWVDCFIAAEYSFLIEQGFVPAEDRPNYPHLNKVQELVHSLPAVKAYYEKRMSQ